MKIGYLVHNLNDPAVERRCRMLERGGASVRLAGFSRDERLAPGPAARMPLLLGQSHDARMGQRALQTARSALRPGPLARHVADCDIIMARNLEQLAIARSVARGRPIVYECLDIHRLLTGTSPPARVLRAVEGWLLPWVDLLLTSSPGFVRNHFAHRPLTAPIVLIENKLLVEDGAPPEPTPAAPALPVRIGWFGMLRCRRTLDVLSDLVRRSDGRIEVLVAGKPSPAELPDLEQRIASVPGMTFHGAYRYADLPALYGRCHFAWTIDWFEEGLNSSWLLPNRLYESLAHGVVPIALADIEIGRWLHAHDCGLTVGQADAAVERLMTLTPKGISALLAQVLAIDRAELIADDADCRALVATLAGVQRR